MYSYSYVLVDAFRKGWHKVKGPEDRAIVKQNETGEDLRRYKSLKFPSNGDQKGSYPGCAG